MDPSAEELFHEDLAGEPDEPDEPDAPDASDDDPAPVQDRIVLQPFQEAAVSKAVQRYTYSGGAKSMLLYGGTGSGKTVVCIETLLRTMHLDLQTNPNPEIVLIVTPSVGGNLAPQWRNELLRQGVEASRVVMLNTPFFRGKTDKWWESLRQTPPFTRCDVPLFVITTFHTLHHNVKKFGDSSIYITLKYTHMVVDECQFYRNGSHRSKKEDVDPDKVMFASIIKVQRQANCRMIVASATPFYNNRVDVYSLVVLMNIASNNKRAWQRDASPIDWKNQKNWFWDNHVVAIIVPPEVSRVNCILRHDSVMGTLSSNESKLAMDAYAHLAGLVMRVLSALQHLPSDNPAVHADIDVAMKCMLGQLTRCRRGLQHPAFYDEPVKRVVRGKEIPVPISLSRLDAFPTDDCSKFNTLVEMLKGFHGRVLVTSHFSRPLDFLEVHLKRNLPEWAVVVHHGQTNCVKAVADFKRLGETKNVVMLATAGSIGEGINLSMTTSNGKEAVRLICLDFPLSNSAQQQLEGRTKRPLAQPDVDHWDVHRIESMADLPRPDHVPSGHVWDGQRATVDQALRKVLALKEHDATELLASDEEAVSLAERGGRGNHGSHASDSTTSKRTLLMALLDTCNAWLDSQTSEEKTAELDRRKKRAEKRKRV